MSDYYLNDNYDKYYYLIRRIKNAYWKIQQGRRYREEFQKGGKHWQERPRLDWYEVHHEP